MYVCYMIDRRLQTLRAVDEYETITAAAEALHLTPSAVSQQLRQLSEDLRVPLLERQGRRVRLTDAARTLIEHADALYARWEQTRADLADSSEGTSSTLRLCGFPTAAASLIAPAAAHLRRTYPDLPVRISEVETRESFKLLLAGDVDIAVVLTTPDSPPLASDRFDQQPLLEEPLDLLVSTDHELATRDSLCLPEVANEPWIVAAEGACDSRDVVLVACRAAGFTPSVAHHAAEWTTVSALVAQGLGVALIPRLAQIPPGESVMRIRVDGPPRPSRAVLTCVRRGSSHHPTIQAGLDALRQSRDDWSAPSSTDGRRPRQGTGSPSPSTGPATDGSASSSTD